MGKKRGKWNEISTEEFEKMIAEIVPVLYEELMARGQEMGETNKVVSETKMEVEGEEREVRWDWGKCYREG